MTIIARYLLLFLNALCRENRGLGGGLISDGKPLQCILEKILVAVFLARLLLFFFVVGGFILKIKL